MVDWKVIATTIYCDSVDADVPIMVFKDWSTKCVGYKKYCDGMTKDFAKTLKKKGKKPNRRLRCEGPECSRVIAYRNKLFAEQEGKNR
jgi:hypothetical protein